MLGVGMTMGVKSLTMEGGFLCLHDDIIPIKFQKYSGVGGYQFRIRNAYPHQRFENMPGWPCDMLRDTKWVRIYLPWDRFPNEVEALAILGSLDGETEREGRYIKVHAAYEAVVNERDIEYSSIRHFLAHPIVRLTRAAVQESVVKRFGSFGVNLRHYQHQKEFYRCIGQMILAVECSVYSRVMCRWDEVVLEDSIDHE
jgi:hypothetical protein